MSTSCVEKILMIALSLFFILTFTCFQIYMKSVSSGLGGQDKLVRESKPQQQASLSGAIVESTNSGGSTTSTHIISKPMEINNSKPFISTVPSPIAPASSSESSKPSSLKLRSKSIVERIDLPSKITMDSKSANTINIYTPYNLNSTISIPAAKTTLGGRLQPHEIAIIQYDSREYSSGNMADYWLITAAWNKNYCDYHGHIFALYTTKNCVHGTTELASPWCKVKAMRQANLDFPAVKFFIYLDSDAVVDYRYQYTPANALLSLMETRLSWDPTKRPLVFNQDGPCWWCTMIQKVGYSMCLNAGTVLWYRHEKSEEILDAWWRSAMDSYEGDPIKRPFRTKWPWEQDRQMVIYNNSVYAAYIQVASQPERTQMKLMRSGQEDWCLSHTPIANCFFSHYCEGKWSKKNLVSIYTLEGDYKDFVHPILLNIS